MEQSICINCNALNYVIIRDYWNEMSFSGRQKSVFVERVT
jgi:hypothetical protein